MRWYSLDLTKLTRDFLKFREFDFVEDQHITGKNEKPIRLSFLINGTNNPSISGEVGKIGVLVKDWARSCGYNVILEAERVQELTGLAKVMVVANRFSATARELAKRIGIVTLTNGELVSIRKIHFSPSAFDP
ncbi:MAG: restriction endonuclease [Candidatus Thorarchaeota archaeon]